MSVRLHLKPILICTLALGGCDAEERTAPTPTPRVEPKEKPVRSGVSALADAEQEVIRHMPDHFADANNLMDAVVQGDLEGANKAGRAIGEHRPASLPADWLPYVQRMRAAGRSAHGATSLDEAGEAAGQLAHACGDCHRTLGGGPKVPPVPVPDREGAEGCMLAHKWATQRLWLGVVAPSDAAWDAATGAFAEKQACREALDAGPAHPEVFEQTRKKLAEQAKAASAAETLEARATVYGQMVATCGTCHTSGC